MFSLINKVTLSNTNWM